MKINDVLVHDELADRVEEEERIGVEAGRIEKVLFIFWIINFPCSILLSTFPIPPEKNPNLW
ncbi:hypothetical protein D0T08_00170 [Emticicia sp. C21]|nr:hypothetical protein D0T08_00170 [Emticicia sp. C21]